MTFATIMLNQPFSYITSMANITLPKMFTFQNINVMHMLAYPPRLDASSRRAISRPGKKQSLFRDTLYNTLHYLRNSTVPLDWIIFYSFRGSYSFLFYLKRRDEKFGRNLRKGLETLDFLSYSSSDCFYFGVY